MVGGSLLLAQDPATPLRNPAKQDHTPLSAIEHVPRPAHYTPMTPTEKLVYNLQRSVDGGALFRTAFSAGVEQAIDTPEPWSNGIDGYAIRYTSLIGFRLAKHTIMSGAEMVLKDDPRDIPTESTTFWGRTKEAIVNTYRIRKDDGGITFNIPRVIGAYGAGFVSSTWQPLGYNTAGDALVSGTYTLGLDAATGVFFEFWPDIKRKVFRTK